MSPTPLQAFRGVNKSAADQHKRTIADGEKMTGAQALVRSLEDLGVKDVFGVPGGAILPVYHAINDQTGFRFILARHEQAAGHAAEGYAVATGEVGVCIVTSGPGATNIITAIADANMDSIPMVVITGQVGVDSIGTDAFQEADIVGATYPLSKHSYLVTNAQDVPRVLAEAHYIARSGRPGPVVVDLTKTAQNGEMYYSWPQRMILPGYNPVTEAHGHVLADAARMFQRSFRPVLYVGGGAVRSDAGNEIKALSDLTGAPIVTTLPARGIVPDDDPAVLGMLGMHGTIAATGAVQRSDLLVAIGARFDDRVTGKLEAFAPGARVIHIDIDPAEIGKNRVADVPIVGDVKTVLQALIPQIEQLHKEYGKPDLTTWWKLLDKWVEQYPVAYEEPTDGTLAPQWVVQQLSAEADPNTIWVSGVGQHQMWATQLIEFHHPHQWISSGGLGTMGFGLPAAIGAEIGSQQYFDGKKPVWLIDGDGSFQMTSEELATAFMEGTPIKIALLNNSVYGMVRQWQTLFYEKHYSATILHEEEKTGLVGVPDFVKLAEAYGCVGLRARTKEEAIECIRKANEINDRPVLIDFHVWKDAMVWPMVAAGDANDNVTYMPGIKPLLNPQGNVSLQDEPETTEENN
ncbi:acetolactate synthase large subunit [Bifidobacterium pseudolongum]|uniref:acetolactate synthase large subunit n=1 Tax=Bifidobacterium pseudolongum TaxID=1694 RepID=UPI0005034D8B|nr:acetolactate synthase large subunit [Bifidobacterium pseudolongum]KFI78141.1 acetolactate synthase large subunit [Bifidobacterium pseudolongum subsp. pseudolongum]PKV00377.1 acetolactate synthase [Bifidobacterium pseudolongum subsp. pseudolongum]RYQ49272.1 acetolactate synthase 1 catalytic subunit [Bifidobacterium pseudolongum subsp. pseudolongum]RYQ52017.1 acetolactate synthase 1 catalytic subunit [Bifidobacterium pseudolongum subsp. pseudolongum]RYQ53926.1 acetolactate synthase 1 catalyti